MKNLTNKLTSRKFWIAIIGMIISLCGIINTTNPTAQMILSIVGAIFGIAYMFIEGKCDWTNLKINIDTIIETIKKYSETDKKESDNTDDKIIINADNGILTIGNTSINLDKLLDIIEDAKTESGEIEYDVADTK